MIPTFRKAPSGFPMKRRAQVSILLASTFAVAQIHAQQVCPSGNRLVAPDNRYSVDVDGVVRDSQTRLFWKQCSEGQSGPGCAGTAAVLNWQMALTAASISSFAGFSDWRLPNRNELLSLMESGCFDPAINQTRFPNTSMLPIWSSTSYVGSASDAWAWAMDIRTGALFGDAKNTPFNVRLVRGGD
jgi:hypothetical protein